MSDMSESNDPRYSDTETLMRSVQTALHNARFARTEAGRFEFISFARSTQFEIVKREAAERLKRRERPEKESDGSS